MRPAMKALQAAMKLDDNLQPSKVLELNHFKAPEKTVIFKTRKSKEEEAQLPLFKSA